MTRKRMADKIKQSLDEQGIEYSDDDKALASAIVDSTLDYVLEFGQEVSQELVGVGLYSEAMVAGVFVRKLKALRNPEL